MSIYMIQFQQGLSMVESIQRYGTEAKAHPAFYKARCPHSIRCPSCGDGQLSRFRRGQKVYYRWCVCRHQTVPLSGAVFEATKLPLQTWLLAFHLMTASKTDMAALELRRHPGVDYKAAWRVKHKLMQAMAERGAPRRPWAFVQIGDAYLGGERNGGKRDRGSENKQAFLIAVQTDSALEHPTYAVVELVRSFDNDRIKDWRARHLAPDSEVLSDGLFCFRRLADTGHALTVLVTSGGRAAYEVNAAGCFKVLLSNIKRHQRRLPRDPAEHVRASLTGGSVIRFDRRADLGAMLSRLAQSMMLCKPHPEPLPHMAINFRG